LVQLSKGRCGNNGDDMRKADALLNEAKEIINGPRQDDYGNAETSFNAVAAMWSAFLGHSISAHQVAVCMALLKAARLRNGPHKDSALDAASYFALSYELSESQNDLD